MIKKQIEKMVRTQLVNLMREKGVTQKDLAERARLPRTDVSRWLSGERSMRVGTLFQLLGALGATPSALVPAREWRLLGLIDVAIQGGNEAAINRACVHMVSRVMPDWNPALYSVSPRLEAAIEPFRQNNEDLDWDELMEAAVEHGQSLVLDIQLPV